jgi:hypothetical protein
LSLRLIGICQTPDIFTEVEANFADFEKEPGSARLPTTASRLTSSATLITQGVEMRGIAPWTTPAVPAMIIISGDELADLTSGLVVYLER